MDLSTIFTRRDPKSLVVSDNNIKVLSVSDASNYKNEIDVLILCGGSATDLPIQGPEFAKMFNTVDSFDTHAKIPQYFESVDSAAKANNNLSIISVGWDPGLFSMNRLLAESVLPEGKDYTFWGRGVSQGHSDAIRRIKGVKGAVQYTIPIDSALEQVRSGQAPELTTREKHLRDCYVVAEEDADKSKIEHEIKTMPNYFSDYDTKVTFISEEELKAKHSQMPHGGFVIRSGNTGKENKNTQIMEFSLKLDSNPELTGSVLVAYARAIYRLSNEGVTGAKTVFDIPLAYLSPKSGEEIRKQLL
jgi:diaminopimelate dehydrogenase